MCLIRRLGSARRGAARGRGLFRPRPSGITWRRARHAGGAGAAAAGWRRRAATVSAGPGGRRGQRPAAPGGLGEAPAGLGWGGSRGLGHAAAGSRGEAPGRVPPVGRECLGRARPRCRPAALGRAGARRRRDPRPQVAERLLGRAGPRPSRHRGEGAVEEAPGGSRHPVATAVAGSGARGAGCRAPLHHLEPRGSAPAVLCSGATAPAVSVLPGLGPAGPALPAHLPPLRGSRFVFRCCLRALPEIGLCGFTELASVCRTTPARERVCLAQGCPLPAQGPLSRWVERGEAAQGLQSPLAFLHPLRPQSVPPWCRGSGLGRVVLPVPRPLGQVPGQVGFP